MSNVPVRQLAAPVNIRPWNRQLLCTICTGIFNPRYTKRVNVLSRPTLCLPYGLSSPYVWPARTGAETQSILTAWLRYHQQCLNTWRRTTMQFLNNNFIFFSEPSEVLNLYVAMNYKIFIELINELSEQILIFMAKYKIIKWSEMLINLLL